MKKGLVMMLSLLFIATTALAGCGAKGGESTAGEQKPADQKVEKSNEPVELLLRHTQLGEPKKNRFAILQDVVKKTEQDVPGLKIKLDGVDSDVNRNEKLRGEMVNNQAPDIFDAFGSPDVGVYAKEGQVLDLTPILKDLGLENSFTSLTPWTHDGKIYGLPIGGSIEGYFYNKKYFAEKGLQAPKTIAELDALAAKIKADGKIPFAQSSKEAWVPLMTTNNLWAYTAGHEAAFGFAKGTAKWNDPKMVEAFKVHQDWVKKGYFKKGELGLDYAAMRNQMSTGEAVMMFDGSWATSVFNDKAQAGDAHGNIGFFLMPPFTAGEGYSIMQDSNNGYAFSAKVAEDPRKLEAVKTFIKNLYNEETQLRGLKEDGVLPSMKIEQAKLDAAADTDLMKQILGTLKDVKYTWPAFDALIQADVTTDLRNGIQKIIGGEVEPQAMLDQLQKAQEEANKAQ
ncbi:ABC transporter substrate-binding protein [Paenibacillus sp. 481]|uniref:ABC transporter substrate-binding protein n=1 Tax=Paenibacillus sp. 481 TaxID=2835869 RepID=UPI001E41E055|nr:extracellular solute-binding protein [Paenibacillus sp. 481]UHA72842.1 extracellular solute-binding protein [Paenibacillus sp. 481]